MSTARKTALRALWGTDEFLDSAGYLLRDEGNRPGSPDRIIGEDNRSPEH